MLLTKQQKIAIKLFKPKGVKYMERLPDDITVISGAEAEEFGQVDILFDTDSTNNIVFKVRVDGEFFLCEDYKLRQCYDMAAIFYKNGKKEYSHIINRAMECSALCLQGIFPKVLD